MLVYKVEKVKEAWLQSSTPSQDKLFVIPLAVWKVWSWSILSWHAPFVLQALEVILYLP